MTTGQISDPARGGTAGPAPTCHGADRGPGSRRIDRSAERALQAVAFDAIGPRYSEAFPAKAGQLAAARRVIAELEPGARVLEIGCGTGDPTVRQLAEGGLTVTAIDLSDGMLSLARRTLPGAADYHRMDLYDLGTARAETAWGCPRSVRPGPVALRRPPPSSR